MTTEVGGALSTRRAPSKLRFIALVALIVGIAEVGFALAGWRKTEGAPAVLFAGGGLGALLGAAALFHTYLIGTGRNPFRVSNGALVYWLFPPAALGVVVIAPVLGLHTAPIYVAEALQVIGGMTTVWWMRALSRAKIAT